MNKKLIILSVLTPVFLFLFFYFVFSSKSVTDIEQALLIKPAAQDVNQRVWRNLDLNLEGVSDEFIASTHMKFGMDGYIYAEDRSRMLVKKFDTQAKEVSRFGKGEGRGPGEFLLITDLMFDSNENLWVIDPGNNRATIFDQHTNGEWDIINFPLVPIRIIPAGTDEYWLENRYEGLPKRFTKSGNFIGEAEAFLNDPQLWSVVFEGRYATAPDGSVILIQNQTNYLLKYNKVGKIEFFREAVSQPEMPGILPYYANDVARVNTPDYSSRKQFSRTASVVNNTIHVFVWELDTTTDNRQWDQKTVDVYNLETGNYLFSYKLPEHVHALGVSQTHLAAITDEDGYLKVWEVVGGWN
ncbi:MAG: 6-bladed beta-propeller [Balneolaceae bacterium]